MRLEHRCSLDWMRERQRYLTASDVKALIPVTKTGRKRDITDLDYLKVMADKMVVLTEDDCVSYGAAARGHILEPYAIDALNIMLEEMDPNGDEMFHWWDDKLVSVHGRQIAFSPDAMDIPMDGNILDATAIAEVKSYEASKHLAIAYTSKEQIEERWQIAHAMAVLENIDHAYLVLFNPKMKYRKTFVIRYDRHELAHEIETILQVELDWREFREHGPLTTIPTSGAIHSHHGGNEETIMREYEERHRLNPV